MLPTIGGSSRIAVAEGSRRSAASASADVKAKILAALRRSAEDSDTIEVSVGGDKVTLDGCVDIIPTAEDADASGR